METKANYLLVAVFSLVVGLLAFGFFYWIGRYGDTRETTTLEIRVPGSVTGLAAKSPVFFNGLKVGEVRRLFVDSTNPDAVIVQTEIDLTTPITRSTVATLAFELLAGQARIELTGGKAYEPKLLEEAEKEDTIARMDIDPSSLKTLVQTAQDWIERVDKATAATEKYLEETRGPFIDSIKQAKTFTDGLADSTELIDKYGQQAQNVEEIMHDARDVISRVNSASVKVDETLANVDKQLSDAKDSTVSEVRAKLQSYQQQAKELDVRLASIMSNLSSLTGDKLRNVQRIVSQSRRTVQRIERGVSAIQDDPRKLIFGDENNVPEYDGKH
ncbi:MlaD family protein [Phyllobacterium zundukense]|uniref:ABC transporter substrate-binding protein n=1 Tax=Phyllobacterium zundukense TaxID=1867719 RepID=A0A2N9W3U4_9HYPH|nr:MlaD family protein [Phyllobacterium zundukense]ATU92114.1 ABC transporter substrate-binding protein [Phyllobacterium zundukense]PIO46412.1 ABC transporter substrate-binding protein [Phyllobacterium zundukense]